MIVGICYFPYIDLDWNPPPVASRRSHAYIVQ